VVHVVVGRGVDPPAERLAREAARVELVAAVGDEPVHEEEQDDEGERPHVQGEEHDDRDEEDLLQQAFHRMPGEGREDRRVQRAVVDLVDESEPRRQMEQPMRPVAPRVVEHHGEHDGEDQIRPTTLADVEIEPGPIAPHEVVEQHGGQPGRRHVHHRPAYLVHDVV